MGEVSLQFPQVFGGGVVFPLDKELVSLSRVSVCDDRFYFVFGFSFYKIWGQFQEVHSVDVIFLIRGEEGGMEDRVDFPLHWKL